MTAQGGVTWTTADLARLFAAAHERAVGGRCPCAPCSWGRGWRPGRPPHESRLRAYVRAHCRPGRLCLLCGSARVALGIDLAPVAVAS